MKCLNCGSELPDNAVFCDNCGQKIQDEQPRIIFCGNCGAELEAGMDFCGECGHSVRESKNSEAAEHKPVKRKRTHVTAVIVIILFCAAAAAVTAGYMIYASNNDDDTAENIRISTSSPKPTSVTPPPANTETALPAAEASEAVSDTEDKGGAMTSVRADLYDSSLTYKRMPEIHNTALTDDAVFNELRSVIIDFDDQCEDYMNEITDDVPSYLKYGTTAYRQQAEYKQKHPELDQSYQKVDVINARQGGGYYYVWVTEVMEIRENGTVKTNTDHWVYKLENNNGQWYICDYTADPAF